MNASARKPAIAGWLFLSSLLLYAATSTGVMPYGDDVGMLQVTAALVQGHVDIPPDAPTANVGVDGRSYSKSGIGQSIVAIPFYLAGMTAQRLFPGDVIVDEHGFAKANAIVYVVLLVGAFATAASVALLFLTCRALGYGVTPSAATAAALGVGTFAWHYARTFMTEPTSMLAVLGAFHGVLRFSGTRDRHWLVLSGVASAIAILVRLSNALPTAVIALWVVYELWPQVVIDPPAARRHAAAWLLPIGAAAGAVAVYNAVRFGGIVDSGYGEEAFAFTTPLAVGVYGFLLSPGKSVFLYAPILCAAIVGWRALARKRPAAAWTAAAIALVQLVFFARYYMWYGGGVWGPRFLLTVLPLGILGLAPIVDTVRGRPRVQAALWLLAAVSFGIQVVSVVVPYVPYQSRMNATPQSFSAFLWDPGASAVVAETASLLAREFPPDVAPVYYHSPLLAVVQGAALICAALAAARTAALVRTSAAGSR